MLRFFLVFIFLLLAASSSGAQTPQNPALAAELAQMVKADQDFRFAMMREFAAGGGRIAKLSPKQEALFRQGAEIDRRNLARLQEIVAQYGWPSTFFVGKQGARNAWLLVQHADTDRPFQRRVLRLMRPLVDRGEAEASDYAYLVDRVLRGLGARQLWGTQGGPNAAGIWEPAPLRDAPNVDTRRRLVGLPPLAEYAKAVNEMMKNPPKP